MNSDDLAEFVFTYSTSVQLKGVILSHVNIVSIVVADLEVLTSGWKDRQCATITLENIEKQQ
ncbi:MAG TPA: hypothetical protein VEL49_04075 [Ktedonobacteraceae bacterium]|nr:hypothetical protein [Ktedonobacteraceae bacterium]